MGPPNPAPLAAASTRRFLIRTTFPTPSPHGNSSVFHPNNPSPSPHGLASEREQLAQHEQVDLEAEHRNSIIFPANKPQLGHSWVSACGWEPRQPQSRGRGVSLCKPSLSEPGFEVQSPTHVFKQRPRLHSSIGSAAPAMRRSPSRCFQPGSQASCCTAASCRAGAALGREQRWGSARSTSPMTCSDFVRLEAKGFVLSELLLERSLSTESSKGFNISAPGCCSGLCSSCFSIVWTN